MAMSAIHLCVMSVLANGRKYTYVSYHINQIICTLVLNFGPHVGGQTFEEKLKGNFHIGSVGQNTGTPQCRRRRKRFLIATGFPPTSRPTDDIIILEQTPTINVTILNQTPFLYIYNIIGCRGRRQICSSTDVCQEIGKSIMMHASVTETLFPNR